MRIAVFSGHAYQRRGNQVYADRSFVLFLGHLGAQIESVVLLGRLDPGHDRARYPLPETVDFVPLRNYESLAKPLGASIAMAGSLRQAWRALQAVDGIWVLGPHPLGFLLIVLAGIRGRAVILGVRQDTRAYMRSRHPGRRWLMLAGWLSDAAWRTLARALPVVAVGPALADQYGHSRRVHELTVSLVPRRRVASREGAAKDAPGNPATILSVGRLEEEKNPLMLAEVLKRLHGRDPGQWRLVVYGEGELMNPLAERLSALGLEDHAQLRGYVPFEEVLDQYQRADVMLLTSWTEGFPQVLVEAFAAGLPAVATDVGGIRRAAGEAVILVPPGDPARAAGAVRELVTDRALRDALLERELAWAVRHTTEAEVKRLIDFFSECLSGARSPGSVPGTRA